MSENNTDLSKAKEISENYKKYKSNFARRITDNFEDSIIPGIWYLMLECGHKTVSRHQTSGMIFCSTCYCENNND